MEIRQIAWTRSVASTPYLVVRRICPILRRENVAATRREKRRNSIRNESGKKMNLGLIIAALLIVETGGEANPNACIQDGGNAVGSLQMWPVAVLEANRIEAMASRREGRVARVWGLLDRFDRVASIDMCRVTLEWHFRRGVTDPVELGARWRNPAGDAPEWYKQRVREALEGMNKEGGEL